MARIWSCGFEQQSVTNGVEWDTTTGAPTINTTTRNSTIAGTAALRCNPAGATAFISHQCTAASSQSEARARVYIYIASAPLASTRILQYGSTAASLKLTSSRTLLLWNDTTNAQAGSASAAIPLNEWHYIELLHDDVGSAGAEGKLDGTSFATFVTGSIGTGLLKVGAIDSATMDVYFDDVAFNTGLAGPYPGPGAIIHLRPDAPGDINASTTLGGSTPAATVWQSINEVTPDDGVTFVSITATGNTNGFLVNLESATTKLTSVTSITLVAVGCRVSATSAASCNYAARMKSGATTLAGATITIAVTAWNNKDDTTPKGYDTTLIETVDPNGSVAWTLSGLDGVQIGAYSPSDVNPNPRIGTMWLLVEYVPAAGGAMSVTIPASATASATLTGTGNMAATIVAAASVTPTLTGTGALSLTAAGVASMTGIGGLFLAASCTITAGASISSTLTGKGAMVVTIPAAASTTFGLTGTGAMTLSVAAAASSTLTLTGKGAMTLTAAGVASCTSTLTGIGALSLTTAGVASITATLTTLASGAMTLTVASAASLGGTLTGVGAMSAQMSASAQLAATLLGTGLMSFTSVAGGHAVATLTGVGDMVMSAPGVAIFTGTLTGGNIVTMAGTSSMSAQLTGIANMTVSIGPAAGGAGESSFTFII